MQHLMLNNGISMPILGFGVYQLTDPAVCEQAVYDALQTGYRLIDTASAYLNEEAVGKGIRRSGLAREDIFVTTKLWVQDQGYDACLRAFDRSMSRLGMEYLDLYLIHWPYGDVYGSWRALEKLYREGRIRAIGVSNFLPDRLLDLVLHNEIIPAVNQVETHPFHQQIDNQRFMQELGIQIEAWSPFAQGTNNLFEYPMLTGIANKHHKTVAQVVLRWLIQRNIICIPKSANKPRIEENFAVFDFTLDDEDMALIRELDSQKTIHMEADDPEMVKMLCDMKLAI